MSHIGGKNDQKINLKLDGTNLKSGLDNFFEFHQWGIKYFCFVANLNKDRRCELFETKQKQ